MKPQIQYQDRVTVREREGKATGKKVDVETKIVLIT